MTAPAREIRPKWLPGERVTDPDGSRWIVVHVTSESGEWGYSRVRAGSLAAQTIDLPPNPALADAPHPLHSPARASRTASGQ